MTDYHELMSILSTPRPNGSLAERETECALRDWLTHHGIPHRVQEFLLYPYFFECIGLWLILSRTVLAIAIWSHWGWIALPIALLGLLGGTLDVAFDLPLVTWPGARRRANILVEFEPASPQQEIIVSAHYDSKTELLDHSQRMFFLKRLKFGIGLTALLGSWGALQHLFVYPPWGDIIHWTGVALTAPMLLLAWGFGLHLSLGRFLKPSQGAVDNGAACAILLGLADRLTGSQVLLEDQKVTLALFSGEEVNMQGSRAFVRSRTWSLPASVLNLEAMGQNGDFIYWQQEGNAFRQVQTSQRLNQAFAAAVQQITGRAAQPSGLINSDGFSFLRAGLPTTTIGTLDTRFGETGFHRPTDNMDRVVFERLPQTVEVLETCLRGIALWKNPKRGSASEAGVRSENMK